MNNNIITSTEVFKKQKESPKFTVNNFNYFKESIEGNLKDNFFSKNPDKKYREGMLERDYRYFTKKLDMFRETVDEIYPDYSEFNFIETHLTKIYRALYTGETLLNVFENNETKNRFYSCMQKYFFGNYGSMSIELVEKYPKKKKSLLSDEEKEALLRGLQDY